MNFSEFQKVKLFMYTSFKRIKWLDLHLHLVNYLNFARGFPITSMLRFRLFQYFTLFLMLVHILVHVGTNLGVIWSFKQGKNNFVKCLNYWFTINDFWFARRETFTNWKRFSNLNWTFANTTFLQYFETFSNYTQGELIHREDHFYKTKRVKIKIQKAQFSCNLEYFSLVYAIYQQFCQYCKICWNHV